jgi:hypothetical protein
VSITQDVYLGRKIASEEAARALEVFGEDTDNADEGARQTCPPGEGMLLTYPNRLKPPGLDIGATVRRGRLCSGRRRWSAPAWVSARAAASVSDAAA